MGPRFFNRGKVDSPADAIRYVLASMGPRFFNRGKHLRFVGVAAFFRCFNGAAVFQPRKVRVALIAGIADSGVNGAAGVQPREGAEYLMGVAQGQGFNGAAVFQPRKVRPIR